MHPCVALPQLRRRIVDHVSLETNVLIALSTTCKVLSESSLDILWRSQSTLFNLVKTMPSDLWTFDAVAEDNPLTSVRMLRPALRFTRVLVESDWERFDYYSKRIQDLAVHTSLGLLPETLSSLCLYRYPQVLLPNLRSFDISFSYGPNEPLMDYIPMLLCESILRLNIIGPEDGYFAQMESILHSIPRVCTNLLELKLTCVEQYGLAIEAALSQLTALEDLEIADWVLRPESVDRLRSLATLKSIQHLQLDDSTKPTLAVVLKENCPALERLGLAAYNWDAAADVLNSLNQPLHSLTVEAGINDDCAGSNPLDPLSPTSASRFLGAVARLTDLTSLVISSLAVVEDSDLSKNLPNIILQLSELRTLDLSNSLTRILDDSWLLRASVAFPKLNTLNLTNFSTTPPPKMTLQGVIPLLKGCSDLDTLELTLQCDPFDTRTLYKHDTPSNVQSLQFINCPVTQPQRVIGCLVVIFPNANTIIGEVYQTETDREFEYFNGWAQINRFFEAYCTSN